MIRSCLARVRALLRSKLSRHRHASADRIKAYWRNPDRENDPQIYLGKEQDAHRRSRFLVELVSSVLPDEATVFELGCNVGRNLSYLHAAGYRHLNALEINDQALELFRRHHPEAAEATTIYNGAAEDLIESLPDRAYELSFTMAVLEHIHSDSEQIFEHLARISGSWLLTIEDEVTWSWRHFPRNYRHVFEPFGFQECKHIQLNMREHGLGSNFHARLFRR